MRGSGRAGPRREGSRRQTQAFLVLVFLGVLLLVVVASAAVWTVYENTSTPAAVAHWSASATSPAPPAPTAAAAQHELSGTATRALAAYGGAAVWAAATTIDSTVTVRGLLFQAKGIAIPPHATVTLDVHRPHAVIAPVDAAGDRGVLDGFRVMVVAPDGHIVEQRADAREQLQNQRLTTQWDRLNLVYFVGYALWGYFTLPAQLTRSDITWTELGPGALQADYGTELPVHSRRQRFWFDPTTGLLRRNDYTPVAATPDARVANIVFAHGIAGGIPYAAKRRVKLSPTQYGWVLPLPDFITIDVGRWQLS